MDGGTIEDRYELVFSKTPPSDLTAFIEAYDAFRLLTLEDLLRFVIPDYALNVETVLSIICTKPNVDDVINLLIEIYSKRQSASSLMDMDMLPKVLSDEIVKNASFDENEVQELCHAMVYMPVKYYSIRNTQNAILVNNYLDKFDGLTSKVEEIIKLYELQKKKKIPKRVQKVFNVVSKLDAIDIAAKLFINIDLNDVAIENSVYYRKIAGSVNLKFPKEHILFINSTPSFIKEWVSDKSTEKVSTTFIISDVDCFNLLKRSKLLAERSSVTIVTYEIWKKKQHDLLDENKITLIAFNQAQKVALPNRLLASVQEFFPSLADNCRILFFVGSTVKVEKDEGKLRLGHRWLRTLSVVLLPQKISRSTLPRRKIIINLIFGRNEKDKTPEVLLQRIGKTNRNRKDYLFLASQSDQIISESQIIEPDMTLRQIHRLSVYAESPGFQSKRLPQSIDFCPELKIWFRKEYQNDKTYKRVEAYLCSPNESTKADMRTLSRGSRIKSTSIKKIVPENQIETWLLTEYPFREKLLDLGDYKTYFPIREMASMHLDDLLVKGKNSWRLYWYLKTYFHKSFSAEENEILKKIMLSDVGLLPTSTTNFEEYDKLLLSAFSDLSTEQLDEYRELLVELLNLAVKDGECDQVLVQSASKQGYSSGRDRFAEVREGLVNRSFTFEQMQRIYLQLESFPPEIKVGVLLRLLTGLSAQEVCALTWSDFLCDDVTGMYYLAVWKEVERSGTIRMLEDTKLRFIPCASLLGKVLNEHKSNLGLETNNDKMEDFLNINVVSKKDDTGLFVDVSVNELLDYSASVVGSIGIKEVIINAPHAKYGFKTVDLTKYQGDLFRSSFEFHARHTMLMTEGEKAYLMGNKPKYTVNQHYIDFSNLDSQYMILCKIERMLASVFNPSAIENCVESFRIESPNSFSLLPKGAQALQATMSIGIEKCANPTIKIRVDNGFDAEIIAINSLKDIEEDV